MWDCANRRHNAAAGPCGQGCAFPVCIHSSRRSPLPPSSPFCCCCFAASRLPPSLSLCRAACTLHTSASPLLQPTPTAPESTLALFLACCPQATRATPFSTPVLLLICALARHPHRHPLPSTSPVPHRRCLPPFCSHPLCIPLSTAPSHCPRATSPFPPSPPPPTAPTPSLVLPPLSPSAPAPSLCRPPSPAAFSSSHLPRPPARVLARSSRRLMAKPKSASLRILPSPNRTFSGLISLRGCVRVCFRRQDDS